MMNKTNKRAEPRLHYQWAVLFTDHSRKTVSEGLMVDLSSGGMAFRCSAGENCPHVGQKLVTHFSFPTDQIYDSTSMISFTRSGSVLRVSTLNPFLCHVALQFDEPLPLKPCELPEPAPNRDVPQP